MKDKYAKLIKELERVTAVYNEALAAVRKLEYVTTHTQGDVLGVYGGVNYHGEKFEEKRSIHLRLQVFVPAAMDCGYDFKMEDREDFTRFECSMFGYRVFSLIKKGATDEAKILNTVALNE